MIEITGARGKTTTAHALASIMPGTGILHTSTGTYLYPGKVLVSQSSITPASVLAAAKLAYEIHGWLIAEESLGVTACGDLSIITSADDYVFAKGKKTALAAKLSSAKNARHLLLAKNIETICSSQMDHIEDIAVSNDTDCIITYSGNTGRFTNPLLAVPGYHSSLVLAAAAGMILGIDPGPLSSFEAIPGRMSVSYENGILFIDNANSGTSPATTIEAAQYARRISANESITLVIGQVAGDGAVCEGFAVEGILEVIIRIHPVQVIWVGKIPLPIEYKALGPHVTACAATLDEARVIAAGMKDPGSVILAVKTWR
jgi:UDP-N-acetylmuramyl pentapeptide synthase